LRPDVDTRGDLAGLDAHDGRIEVVERRPRIGSSGDGAYRDRTGDLRLAKPALSQLS
jgi:hypothetical protein